MLIRKYLYWILAGLFLFYLIRHRADLLSVVQVIFNGTWYWIAFATLFQVFHYLFHGSGLREGFASVAIERKKREYIPIALAALAVNVAAPSMNVSGAAFVVDESRKRGFPPVSSLIGTAIAILSDGVVFVVGALVVAGLLFSNQELSASVLLGVLFLAALILTLVGLVLFFWKKPHSLNWLFRILGKKREVLWREEWHSITAVELPLKRIWRVLFYHLLSHATNVASLVAVFLAFGVDPANLLPAAAYIVSFLFIILSPTPMGIGFAEGGMALTLVGMGMPEAQATAITVAFRGLSFWLPLLFGAFFLHRLRARPTSDDPNA